MVDERVEIGSVSGEGGAGRGGLIVRRVGVVWCTLVVDVKEAEGREDSDWVLVASVEVDAMVLGCWREEGYETKAKGVVEEVGRDERDKGCGKAAESASFIQQHKDRARFPM